MLLVVRLSSVSWRPLLRLVLLRHQERGSFNFVNHHEFISALWHWKIFLSPFLEEPVETLHLFVFLNKICDVACIELCNLCDLLLVLGGDRALLILFGVCESRTDFCLILKSFHFDIVSPDHHFEG